MTTLISAITTYQSVVNTAIASTNLTGMWNNVSSTMSTTMNPYWVAGYAFADPTALKASCMGAATATATCMNSPQLLNFDGTIFFVTFTDPRAAVGAVAVWGICLPNPASSALPQSCVGVTYGYIAQTTLWTAFTVYSNWIASTNLTAVTGLAPLYLGLSTSGPLGLTIILPVLPNVATPKSGVTISALSGTMGYYMGWQDCFFQFVGVLISAAASGTTTTDTFSMYSYGAGTSLNGPTAGTPTVSLLASYCWASTASTPTATISLPVATTGGSISMWYPLYTIKQNMLTSGAFINLASTGAAFNAVNSWNQITAGAMAASGVVDGGASTLTAPTNATLVSYKVINVKVTATTGASTLAMSLATATVIATLF